MSGLTAPPYPTPGARGAVFQNANHTEGLLKLRPIHFGLFLFLVGLPAPADANRFDVIFTETIDLTLCFECGFNLSGLGYGLIVNTGTRDITLGDLEDAQVTAVSSNPDFPFSAWITIPIPQLVGSIRPGEALGSVVEGNELLLPLIRPGENFRNLSSPTVRRQFMAFSVLRRGNYVGPVDFFIRIALAVEVVDFTIHANTRLGPHEIAFLEASRVASVVPEPGSGLLIAMGLALLARRRGRLPPLPAVSKVHPVVP